MFKPLLYELVNGAATPEEVAPPFVQLLAPYSVNFIQASHLLGGAGFVLNSAWHGLCHLASLS